MCPFCAANMAVIAAGLASSGVAAAGIANRLLSKDRAKVVAGNLKQRLLARKHSAQKTPSLSRGICSSTGKSTSSAANGG